MANELFIYHIYIHIQREIEDDQLAPTMTLISLDFRRCRVEGYDDILLKSSLAHCSFGGCAYRCLRELGLPTQTLIRIP